MMYLKLLLHLLALGIIHITIMLCRLDRIMFINISRDHLDQHLLLALQLELQCNIQDQELDQLAHQLEDLLLHMEDTVDMDIILLLTEIHTLVLTVTTQFQSELQCLLQSHNLMLSQLLSTHHQLSQLKFQTQTSSEPSPAQPNHLVTLKFKNKDQLLIKWKEQKIKLQLTKVLIIVLKKKRRESLKQLTKEWLRSTLKKQHKLLKHIRTLKKLKLLVENPKMPPKLRKQVLFKMPSKSTPPTLLLNEKLLKFI